MGAAPNKVCCKHAKVPKRWQTEDTWAVKEMAGSVLDGDACAAFWEPLHTFQFFANDGTEAAIICGGMPW